jgi:hypothetical protein
VATSLERSNFSNRQFHSLFSCIESWLKKQKSCPLCKAKARIADIRVFFNSNIITLDTRELEFTLNQLKKEQRERAKVDLEKAKVLLEARMWKDKYEASQRELKELKM